MGAEDSGVTPDQSKEQEFAANLAQLGKEQESERHRQRMGCAAASGVLGAIGAVAGILLIRAFGTLTGEDSRGEVLVLYAMLVGSVAVAVWALIRRKA